MFRKLIAAIFILAAVCTADARPLKGVVQHVGQVAARSMIPILQTTSLKYTQTRYAQPFRDSVSQFQILLPCRFGAAGSLTGSNCTVTASVEYPANNFTQVKFSGSVTGTIIDGTDSLSDPINLSVASGDIPFIRVWLNNATGIITTIGTGRTQVGDGWECSATAITDKTMGGTLSNTGCSGVNLMYGPIAVVGVTSKPSICVVGDSIAYGADGVSATGDYGYAREISSAFAYINMAISGESAATFITNHAWRVSFANSYCSHLIINYAVNDINAGASLATIQANLQTVWGYFTGKVYQTTITPALSAASPLCPGSLSNGPLNSGQTPRTTESVRVALNAWLRGTPVGIAGYFDPTTVAETSLASGKFVTDGVTCFYTGDGLHPDDALYNAYLSNNVFPLSTFTFPP